jgi:hypothetical protein
MARPRCRQLGRMFSASPCSGSSMLCRRLPLSHLVMCHDINAWLAQHLSVLNRRWKLPMPTAVSAPGPPAQLELAAAARATVGLAGCRGREGCARGAGGGGGRARGSGSGRAACRNGAIKCGCVSIQLYVQEGIHSCRCGAAALCTDDINGQPAHGSKGYDHRKLLQMLQCRPPYMHAV